MSILSGPEIQRLIEQTKRAKRDGSPVPVPSIDIEPFDPAAVGPNSVDLTLADKMLVYEGALWNRDHMPTLDCAQKNPTDLLLIQPGGFVLQPGILYLGVTVESIAAHGLVPWIDGRSSAGRLGIQIHMTAGRADDGWEGPLTLEITCVHPIRIYAGMRLAQVTFFRLEGERKPYAGRYAGSRGPVASKLHEDKR